MATAPNPTPAKLTRKQRVVHELKDYASISTYLAILFSVVTAYTLLLNRHNDIDSTLSFGFGIINALVLGKVILIGEMIGVGRRSESRPLYQTVLVKSALFGFLIFAFHLVEEFIKRLIHHEPTGTVLRETSLEQLLARSIIVLMALIPLFAFRELSRVLGEQKLHTLFTQHPTPSA